MCRGPGAREEVDHYGVGLVRDEEPQGVFHSVDRLWERECASWDQRRKDSGSIVFGVVRTERPVRRGGLGQILRVPSYYGAVWAAPRDDGAAFLDVLDRPRLEVLNDVLLGLARSGLAGPDVSLLPPVDKRRDACGPVHLGPIRSDREYSDATFALGRLGMWSVVR